MPILYEESFRKRKTYNSVNAVVVTAIRVQDITTQIWYSWDNGSWGANGAPQCTEGGIMYIAFYAVNNSAVLYDIGCHLQLWVDNNNIITKNESVPQGQSAGFGIEWTGLMPVESSAIISCVSWSDSSPTQKVMFTITGLTTGGGNGGTTGTTTVTVTDAITKKPIAGATLMSGTNTATTDSTGTAAIISSGTIQVSASMYISKTVTPTTTTATVSLIPIWPIAVGAVGAVAIIAAVALK